MSNTCIILGGRDFELLNEKQLARVVELVGPIDPHLIDDARVEQHADTILSMGAADLDLRFVREREAIKAVHAALLIAHSQNAISDREHERKRRIVDLIERTM